MSAKRGPGGRFVKDDQPVEETAENKITMVPSSPEAQNWARRLMQHVRELEALHQPIESQSEVDGDRLICAECGRIEAEALAEANHPWRPAQSFWPCPTAIAGGWAEEPIL